MMYVIKRTDQSGGFVTEPGSEKAYTQKLQGARVFPTREEAKRHLCLENECVVAVGDLIRGGEGEDHD